MKSRAATITFLSLALLLPLIPFAPGAVALQSYTEDFETDTVGGNPSAPFYLFELGGTHTARSFISSAQGLGSKSFYIDSTGPLTPVVDFDLGDSAAGVDLCSTASPILTFAFRFALMPAGATDSATFNLRSDATVATSHRISARGDGSILVGATTVVPAASVVVNTWYNVSISPRNCSNSPANSHTVNVFFPEFNAGTTIVVGASVADLSKFSIGTGGGVYKMYFDNLAVSQVNDPPPEAVGSAALVSVTDLTGFDVDPTGSGLIARTNGGLTLRAYNPRGLTELGSRTADCNGAGNQNNDMVAASDRALVMIICDAGSKNPAFLSIRGLNMDEYDFPGNCSPSDDCLDDIDLRGDDAPGSQYCLGWPDDLDVREIADMSLIPLDYSYITDPGFPSDDARAIAVAYSTDTGYVGVLQYTTRGGALGDKCAEERLPYSGTAPTQISVWQPGTPGLDGTQTTYIAAVNSGSPTKIYQYVPTIVNPDGNADWLDGNMIQYRALSISSGRAISCHDVKCLILTTAATNNLHLVNIDNGTEYPGFPITVTSGVDRGAALSQDTTRFAVVSGAGTLVGYTSNGTTVAQLTNPTGTFKELRVEGGLREAWIATAGSPGAIAYYDVQTEVLGFTVPKCLICSQDPEASVGAAGLAGRGDAIGAALGIGDFGGNLLGGFILMFVAGAGVAHETKKTIGWVIGAAAGLVMAWAFSFVEDGAIFVIVLIVAGAGYLAFRARAARGG